MSKLNSSKWKPRRRPSSWGLPALFSCSRKGHPGGRGEGWGGCHRWGVCACRGTGAADTGHSQGLRLCPLFFAAGKRIRNIAQNSVIRASPLPSPSSPHRGTAHRRGRLHSTRLPQHSTWALTVQISTQHTIACLYSNTCLHVPCSYMPLSHPPLAYSCAQDQIQLNCCTPSPGLNSSRSFQGVFG